MRWRRQSADEGRQAGPQEAGVVCRIGAADFRALERTMSGQSLLVILLVGLIAGWLAGKIVGAPALGSWRTFASASSAPSSAIGSCPDWESILALVSCPPS